MKALQRTVLAAALMLFTSTNVVADPPPCSFKVYNCRQSEGCTELTAEFVNVYVFNGNDSVHLVAAFESAALPRGRYAEVNCNEGTCDTTIYTLDQREWTNDYCGDL